ncbi:MAG: CapA family protein [Deltaproteobacteria bacterium]|nr:CapA family protein [Deltaproteobacteria bacterium]
MSFANNHTLDRGEEAFFETIDTLTKNNIAVVGVGRNIGEARKPSILERKGTKVAFLAYCSVLPEGIRGHSRQIELHEGNHGKSRT